MEKLSFKAILTDVEGTTTSIDFVKNILFPFSSQQAGIFIRKLNGEQQHQKILDDLINTSNEYTKENNEVLAIGLNDECEARISKLISNVLLWIKQDKKYTALKNLQGLIWEDGYQKGLLKAHYQRIVEQIGISPNNVLFLTDIEKEAYAAKSAGLQVRLALRPGNAPLSESALKEFITFSTFEEIFN